MRNKKDEVLAMIADCCLNDLSGEGNRNEEAKEFADFFTHGIGLEPGNGMSGFAKAYFWGFCRGFEVHDVLHTGSSGKEE